jgi:predicted ester cyclase
VASSRPAAHAAPFQRSQLLRHTRTRHQSEENMSPEENKAIVRRFIEEAVNGHRPEAVRTFFAPEYVNHDPLPGETPGLDGLESSLRTVLTAFPDYRSTIEELVAEGDRVAYLERNHATHDGPFMGIPPTGRRVDFRVAGVLRLANGKIVERRAVADQLTLLQQLGVLPPPPPQPPSP